MAGTTTLLLPIGWGTTVGQTSQPVLPANGTRNGVMFINSGSVAIAICPANVIVGVNGAYPTVPAGSPGPVGVAAIGGAGSITMQPGDKFIIDNLPCSCGWNGIAGGVGGVLTILEFC